MDCCKMRVYGPSIMTLGVKNRRAVAVAHAEVMAEHRLASSRKNLSIQAAFGIQGDRF